jgi:hypothetical protein
MALQHPFDVAWIDVLAAANKHVIGPSDEEEESVRVTAENVAGAVIAVGGHCLRRHLRQLMIVRHQSAAPHLQYALALDLPSVAHQS